MGCFDAEVFARNLKTVMAYTNTKNKDLANALNYREDYISKIKTGKRTPPLPVVYQMCEFFDVSMDWLCGRKED